VTAVAYLTNQLPSPVEWYVVDEINELRRRHVRIVPCSSQPAPARPGEFEELRRETLYLWPLCGPGIFAALGLFAARLPHVLEFLEYAFAERGVSLFRRLKAVLHTLIGVYYAALLREQSVDHIHVHHGYFSSWVAMVAARMLDIPFSMTLHGSDVLLHSAFLAIKLRECAFCFTVSDFNRRYILRRFPETDAAKVRVQRLGVEVSPAMQTPLGTTGRDPVLLAIGRLHPVKNHTFLLQACYLLRECGVRVRCLIVGEGPERHKLEMLIRQLGISNVVSLVGHVRHDKIGAYYELADLVVLTSHSEGIPLVLMEAMARGKVVLAPHITGISELVIDGETGFLFTPGQLDEFIWRVQQILSALDRLGPVQRAARRHVQENFERAANLERFADNFLQAVGQSNRGCEDEDLILQQI
jgi:colanic acid/amylovoran biosynthesis glycosyltransferase